MNILQQYKNLSKEIYILFFGRIVTSMGSLIWPLLTLILKNKLGYDATTIAMLTLGMSVLQFPMMLLGGKLADTLNRKYIIIVCDLVTVISYVTCGLLPLSGKSIVLFYLAGLFATIEGPSYDALVADLSDSESREKAYSLQYLGMNLGVVLAPTIAGMLFENYLWLAFLITGIATFSSTVLIFLFVKRLRVEKRGANVYEEKREHDSVFRILIERKVLLLYVLIQGFTGFIYSQFNYLLPLNMENLYGAKGAKIFGMLTSTNGLIVIIATPLITTFLWKIMDVRKILIGETLIVLGLSGYRLVQGMVGFYFLLMILFTIGEVFQTLGQQPYMTRRIPETHWGRMNSFAHTAYSLCAGLGNIVVGRIVDTNGFDAAWLVVGAVGTVTILLIMVLNIVDKRQFHLLY